MMYSYIDELELAIADFERYLKLLKNDLDDEEREDIELLIAELKADLEE